MVCYFGACCMVFVKLKFREVRNMKKIYSFIITALIVFMLAVPALAEFKNPAVTDNAGFLTEQQAETLENKLEIIRTAYEVDVAVYTEDKMSGDSAEETADDIFDYNGYGDSITNSGVILYVSREPRNYHFSTYSTARGYFSDSRLEEIESAILPYLKKNDYYGAFTVYADYADKFLESSANSGEDYSYYENEDISDVSDSEYTVFVLICALILPLIIAFIMMLIKQSKMKTAVKQNYADSYMTDGSIHLTQSNDIYLYSTVTKTPIPQSDDSDSHTSSSGRTHGGIGGSY